MYASSRQEVLDLDEPLDVLLFHKGRTQRGSTPGVNDAGSNNDDPESQCAQITPNTPKKDGGRITPNTPKKDGGKITPNTPKKDGGKRRVTHHTPMKKEERK